MLVVNCHNLVRLFDASCWPTTHGGKKVKWPSIFKLTQQQHTNNWEVDILFLQCIVPPPIDVSPFGYGKIYNIIYNDKQYDVTIGNILGCSCIYFVTMLVASLGSHGAYV
jgi:hypothetical protein